MMEEIVWVKRSVMSPEFLNENFLKDLKSALGETLLSALKETYMAETRQRLQNMVKCWKAGDLHQVGTEARALEGDSTRLGLVYLSLSAQTLRQACEREEHAHVEDIVLKLTRDVETTLDHLHKFS